MTLQCVGIKHVRGDFTAIDLRRYQILMHRRMPNLVTMKAARLFGEMRYPMKYLSDDDALILLYAFIAVSVLIIIQNILNGGI